MYPSVTFDDLGNVASISEETLEIERYNITTTTDGRIFAGVDVVAQSTPMSEIRGIEDALSLPYEYWIRVFDPIHEMEFMENVYNFTRGDKSLNG